jgi:uncharacterized membrane protein YhdT
LAVVDRREPSRLGTAALTVAGLVVPILAAFLVAVALGPVALPDWLKLAAAFAVMIGGFVVAGRAAVRAMRLRYPPVSFTASDPGPALGAMTDTVRRLGPRNHVVFGLAPVTSGGSLQALVSVKTDRHGSIVEQVVQVPYAGHDRAPVERWPEVGAPLPTGWEILGWEANEYAIAAAPATASLGDLLDFTLTAMARLHGVGDGASLELTFVV